ncbi:MAG: hypothetical protein OZSIB_1772 [Candidatus Ozemobacter sibiricus]|jgi:hypothetical protein|uniref:GNAT family N-acetyltransferase n=1 Tax=Candidatus Ozemobacter sibiricus TaxID=2268124 RepID=A0A367ZJ12_9BACT|nr:MAG: hypothetical protein OZSIB_1772 [Candidatus Ozemobacter sibiricus]
MDIDRHEPPAGEELYGRILEVTDLSIGLIEEMFWLMDRYFFVDRVAFERDLSRKDWVLLLRDRRNVVRGFTSLKLIKSEWEGRPVQALYSGDTVIQREFWGSLELPRIWGRFMLERIAAAGDVPLYWFLLSSGYKTYRFLPVFFKEFYPCCDQPTPPAMAALLDHFGTLLFGSEYHPDTGTVHLSNPTPLREGVAEVTAERLADPHVAFFVKRNPDHTKGVELACLAPLRADNLRPYIRRVLKA